MTKFGAARLQGKRLDFRPSVIGALVATVMVSAATPALAQWYGGPGPWGPSFGAESGARPIPPRAIAAGLQRRGYSPLARPRLTGDVYVVDAVTPRGEEVRLVVDAFDGRVVDRSRIAEALVPPRNVGRDPGAEAYPSGPPEMPMGPPPARRRAARVEPPPPGPIAPSLDAPIEVTPGAPLTAPAPAPVVQQPLPPPSPEPKATAAIAAPPPPAAAPVPAAGPRLEESAKPARSRAGTPASARSAPAPAPEAKPAPEKAPSVAAAASPPPSVAETQPNPHRRVRVIQGVTTVPSAQPDPGKGPAAPNP